MAGSTHAEQRQNYAATLLGSTSYGMYLMLAVASLHLMLKRRRRRGGQAVAIAYTITMLVVNTIWMISASRWNAYIFVDLPFDPEIMKLNFLCSPAGLLTKITATLQVLLSDGLLVYRAYVIWEGTWFIVGPPCFVYAVCALLGVVMNLRCGVPRLLVKSIDVPLHEAFFVATICCNVIATGLISARLILHRRSLLAIGLSERPSFTNYSTFASIFADSAALYALVGIIYLPIYFEQLPVQAVFSSLFAALTILSPAVIILRVSLGVSYDHAPRSTLPWHETRDTVSEPSPTTPMPPHDPTHNWPLSQTQWHSEKYSPHTSLHRVDEGNYATTSSPVTPEPHSRH